MPPNEATGLDIEPPENMKLETLAEFIGYDHQDAHDALADVRATVAYVRKYGPFVKAGKS